LFKNYINDILLSNEYSYTVTEKRIFRKLINDKKFFLDLTSRLKSNISWFISIDEKKESKRDVA